MFIVKFQGGLGNQMFQYAFMLWLEEKFNGIKVYGDLSNYNIYNPHNGYELDKIFNIKVREAEVETVRELTNMFVPKKHKYLIPSIDRQLNKLMKKIYLSRNNNIDSSKVILQDYSSGYPMINVEDIDINRDYYFDGTWMNYNYSNIYNRFSKIFTFPKLSCQESIDLKNSIEKINQDGVSISIHMRRGDYEGTELDILGEKYYKDAIELFRNKYGDKVTLVVFADDLDWAKGLVGKFKNINIIYSENNVNKKDYDDMILMSKCHHNIISNSTFSYWGALLNDNKEKIIIRPAFYAKNKKNWSLEWTNFKVIDL